MRLARTAAGAVLLLGLTAVGPQAQTPDIDTAAIARVGGLDALKPLDTSDLGRQLGGRLTQTLPVPRQSGGPVRLWDELTRPRPPAVTPQGTITSTSRGVR